MGAWVEAGGGLLVLGGLRSLGNGEYHRPAIGDLLPVTVSEGVVAGDLTIESILAQP